MAAAKHYHVEPQIGDGIYLVSDVAKILNLDYDKVRRWIVGYWDGSLQENTSYVFGEKKNRAINFYSLIEFYTFFNLREQGYSVPYLKKIHKELSIKLDTKYPFAMAQEFFREKKGSRYRMRFAFVRLVEGMLKLDGKGQLSFDFLYEFLNRIEFDDNNLAAKFFPLHDTKNVVVDPKHQFGQPTINGTNIKTQTIYSLHKGGETNENICILYNLPIDKVQDAISFHENAA
mgnify:CR=1 FL=1